MIYYLELRGSWPRFGGHGTKAEGFGSGFIGFGFTTEGVRIGFIGRVTGTDGFGLGFIGFDAASEGFGIGFIGRVTGTEGFGLGFIGFDAASEGFGIGFSGLAAGVSGAGFAGTVDGRTGERALSQTALNAGFLDVELSRLGSELEQSLQVLMEQAWMWLAMSFQVF